MKCVSYDHTFASHISENFPRYPEMLREDKERKAKEKRVGKQKKTPKHSAPSAGSSRRPPIPRGQKKGAMKQPDDSDSDSDSNPQYISLASSSTAAVFASSLDVGRARRSVRSR